MHINYGLRISETGGTVAYSTNTLSVILQKKL